MKTYIHYGSKEFNPELFCEIKNRPYFSKPEGGFWASSVDSENGWIDWCRCEEFYLNKYTEENSFKFKLSDNSKILRIYNINDLDSLPMIADDQWIAFTKYLDFEAIKDLGYDAVEVSISSDHRLYYELYGWDCDSIVIMNKDIIIPL